MYSAIEQFGPPDRLITDNGGVFRAKQLLRICESLHIEKEYIKPRQSWMNLVEQHLYVIWNSTEGKNSQITRIMWTSRDQGEAQFHIISVMRRMSQYKFEQVTSWEGAKLAHRRFVDDYDHQVHWAFRHRTDNRHTPAEVLGWTDIQRLRTSEELHRIFYATRFLCRLDRLGYAHFRRWKLYGEEALARYPAVIWLHGEALTVEHAEVPLAQYSVQYQPDKKHFRDVPTAERLVTPYRSPQGHLWELDDKLWKLATKLPDYAPRKRQKQAASFQPPLFDEPQAEQA